DGVVLKGPGTLQQNSSNQWIAVINNAISDVTFETSYSNVDELNIIVLGQSSGSVDPLNITEQAQFLQSYGVSNYNAGNGEYTVFNDNQGAAFTLQFNDDVFVSRVEIESVNQATQRVVINHNAGETTVNNPSNSVVDINANTDEINFTAEYNNLDQLKVRVFTANTTPVVIDPNNITHLAQLDYQDGLRTAFLDNSTADSKFILKDNNQFAEWGFYFPDPQYVERVEIISKNNTVRDILVFGPQIEGHTEYNDPSNLIIPINTTIEELWFEGNFINEEELTVRIFTGTPLEQTFDDLSNALVLSNVSEFCSPNAAYSNEGATADGPNVNGWSNSPEANVWFKFQATENTINTVIHYGGDNTMRNGRLALFDENLQELAASRAILSSSVTSNELTYSRLAPGNWYYIAVDNRGNRGTFALCVNNYQFNDAYDFAEAISSTDDFCSENNVFTTANATEDGPRPQEWSSGFYNVWYSFVAEENGVDIQFTTDGDMRGGMLALFDHGLQEIVSIDHAGTYDARTLRATGLVPGQTYLISVATYREDYRGSFNLCVDQFTTNDTPAGAQEITTLIDNCSASDEFSNEWGAPDGNRPSEWQNGPNSNVWFKFTPNKPGMRITLKPEASLRWGMLALYDQNNVELVSEGYPSSSRDDVVIAYNNLTPGEEHFLSVDSRYAQAGTFGLCMEAYETNDYKRFATVLDPTNYCSTQAGLD
ncbi:MAG: hypothetical protein AAFO69_16000, partial [Bacteroidota bacterium]